MLPICPIHTASFHCFVCKHVAQTCRSGDTLPTLGELSPNDVVCTDCLTPQVRELRRGLSDDTEHYFDYFDQLKQEIGYSAMCTECLYEKTGLDLRRHSSSRGG